MHEVSVRVNSCRHPFLLLGRLWVWYTLKEVSSLQPIARCTSDLVNSVLAPHQNMQKQRQENIAAQFHVVCNYTNFLPCESGKEMAFLVEWGEKKITLTFSR